MLKFSAATCQAFIREEHPVRGLSLFTRRASSKPSMGPGMGTSLMTAHRGRCARQGLLLYKHHRAALCLVVHLLRTGIYAVPQVINDPHREVAHPRFLVGIEALIKGRPRIGELLSPAAR